MNGKFKTTSSTLFNNNNNNNSQLPNWMRDMNTDVKKSKELDLEFELKGAFEENVSVNREEKNGSLRKMANYYNESRLITESKIELAKFLSGKYYKVEAHAKYNIANLNVKIGSVPADFTFNFKVNNNNKLVKGDTFFVTLNNDMAEYPFSQAGFEECLSDINKNNIKTSQTVNGVDKAYVITREEIIRRYNGHLRPAMEKINKLLEDGEIIGAGSNCYASFNDIDYLFPQMEKEAEMPEKLPEFDFAPNTEHVAAKEYKSANLLSIEASKTLSHFFNDFSIKQCLRDNNELLVKADILSNNGTTKRVDFCFGIDNEKVDSIKIAEINDNRYTMDQLLDKLNYSNNALDNYLNNNNSKIAKRIYRGVVLTHKEIQRKLANIVKKDNINKIINNWVERELVTPVNSTTYTTTKTFSDLLSMIKVSTLSNKEKNDIKKYSKKFGDGLESERQNIKDTGVREAEEKISDETLLNSANKFLSKYFKNFEINDSNALGERVNYSVQLFDDETGVSAIINISLNYDGNKVKSAEVDINGRQVEISKVKEAFAKNEILSKYLEKSYGKKKKSNIIMSKQQMISKLKDISNTNLNEIESTIADWETNNKIKKLSSNKFGSDYTFEELISMSNLKPLTDDEIKERINKSKRDKGKNLTSAHIQDQENRKMIDKWSSDKMLIFAKTKLNKRYNDYDILDVNVKDNSYIVTARVVNPRTGIREKAKIKFSIKNNKLNNDSKIESSNIKNDAVEKYLQFNKENGRKYKRIINKDNFNNKLLTVADNKDLNEINKKLVENNVVIPINSREYATNYSLSEIISYLSRFNLTNIEAGKKQRKLSQKNDHSIKISKKRIMDNDNRKLQANEKTLSPQLKLLKNKIEKTAKKAYNNKKITKNKLNQIVNNLNDSKTHRDLESTWKELKRYFK